MTLLGKLTIQIVVSSKLGLRMLSKTILLGFPLLNASVEYGLKEIKQHQVGVLIYLPLSIMAYKVSVCL